MTFKVMRILLVSAVLAAGCTQWSAAAQPEVAAGEFHFDGDRIVLKLKEKGLHPKVLVNLGDGEPNAFVVDTGAGVNVIDSRIAAQQGYEVVGQIEVGAPGGNQVPGNIVRVPLARVGEATIRHAEFVTVDLEEFSGGQMQGVLGLPLFSKYLLMYDLEGGLITVSKGHLKADDPGVQPYEEVASHLRIDVDVAGTRVPSHIDTGSMGGFTLPGELKDALPLSASPKSAAQARLIGGARNIEFGILDGVVSFAGVDYPNPNLAFMDPSPGAGNIGGEVLRDFLMTIDQTNQLVRFEKIRRDRREQHHSAADSPRKLGLMLRNRPGNSAMVLATVIPDSLAENAGLQAGDELVALNGLPIDQYDMSDLGELFKGATPLRFEVQRAGKAMIMKIE